MSELDRQRQEVEEVMSNENEITIQVYYTIDEETGIRHYDTDSMRDEFDKEIEQQRKIDEQKSKDGWLSKFENAGLCYGQYDLRYGRRSV